MVRFTEDGGAYTTSTNTLAFRLGLGTLTPMTLRSLKHFCFINLLDEVSTVPIYVFGSYEQALEAMGIVSIILHTALLAITEEQHYRIWDRECFIGRSEERNQNVTLTNQKERKKNVLDGITAILNKGFELTYCCCYTRQ